MTNLLRVFLFGLLVVAITAPVTGSIGRLRWLALGDSYTIGEGVEAPERWPLQLASALRREGLEVADPEIVARTGWTVGELSAALDASPPKGRFDLVTLQIGVNDQYRDRDPVHFAEEFKSLLKRAVAWAGGRPDKVVVVTIPDWSVTPFAAASGRDRAEVARQLGVFNKVVADEARRSGCPVVDITPVSRRAGVESGLLVADGLHPSSTLYAAWVKLILPVAHAALASPSPTAH